ncbi:MAG TPA: UDP-N-acetylglucosamine 2-epimerase (non-hydrolyzing) [Thermoleophilaceae bacterium]
MIGARPEIIQAAPLSAALAGHLDEVLVHTGQHYDAAMSGLQIADVKLPEPDYNLGVGSLPDAEQLALTEERVGEVIEAEQPDAVLVRGDTNATLAAARAAAKRLLPLFHVEAGLRSYRADMPEERNRIEADRLADVLLAPTHSARDNLLAERVKGSVHVTGDVLADVLLATAGRLPRRGESGEYVVATVHRNYNTDDPGRLASVLDCLGTAPCRVILPLHPRTRTKIEAAGLSAPANVELRDPVTYSEMLVLERDAVAVATDSGGVQREAYVWGVPCVTLREETEWVETVELGWNTLVGVDPKRFRAALDRRPPAERPPIFGQGHAADAIAVLVAGHLGGMEASVA